ncbi:unnamed protein product (macronuclear) [Paramecium tetraurelia]|uniref:TNFR-Cys domain-containing protein n=1 Tax=Paramecium tetraurelia TaxID=5888 RepID=A0CK28_PARTE|nr:uncharacterized protein GSPATT00000857001 [Paramecium tetraurelia]CAK71145.1 unnamed protein product [Paramecium tetraurelia]|eukprot:XP_001438542.1 hypothetical protein (macronuclear) [Paramecium tetraurelia strain d4-2]
MILFRLAIALLTIQSCSSQSTQWVVTHHEGWDSGFNQFQQDVGLVTDCQRPNYQIIRSNPYLQKTISFRNFKPFAHSLVVIDYLRPQGMDVQIQIQNKTYDPKEIDQIYERQIIDDCLVGDIQYIEQTFVQEIFGNQIQELNIVLIGGQSKKGIFTAASDQKIAIKQIHILQLQCPEFCERCVYQDNAAVCTQCNEGFETHGSPRCTCSGFNQNGICVEKCFDGFSPDFYDICQNREIIKTIKAQQNLRKNYRKDEPLELEFDLESYRAFEIDMEVQIYNFDYLQIFQFTMNDGLYAYYLNIDGDNNSINFQEISYRDCESEQFCQIYHFKSKILQLEQSKLNLQVQLSEDQYPIQFENEQQKKINTYWKLVNLNINVLMIQNTISHFEHCSEIAKFGFSEKCIKCQAPFIALDGQCVEKCPFQSPLGEDLCFDSDIQNTQIWQLDVFKNQNQYQNEKYWFYNEEPLISISQPQTYRYQYLKPHYGISIQTKILFINENSKFVIVLEDQQIVVTPSNKDQYNQGNQNKSDSFVYLNQFIPHNDIELSFQIQSSQMVGQSYITNTVLLVHQCTRYCKSCSGPKKSDCLEFETELHEFNAITKQCNAGYFETKGEYCIPCAIADCLVCSDGIGCQQCQLGCKQTKYGRCDCN